MSPYPASHHPMTGRRHVFSLLGVLLLTACGGGGESTTSLAPAPGGLSVLVVTDGPTVTGGQDCTPHLTLKNPDNRTFDFTYNFNAFDQSGRTIATATFKSRIDPLTTRSFTSSWQPLQFTNTPRTVCTSIVSTAPGTKNTIPVTTAIRLRPRISPETTASSLSGVWSDALPSGPAGALSIDRQGRFFGQNGQGCVFSGRLDPGYSRLENRHDIDFDVTACPGLEGHYSGIALHVRDIDPNGQANDLLLVWSETPAHHRLDFTVHRN